MQDKKNESADQSNQSNLLTANKPEEWYKSEN